MVDLLVPIARKIPISYGSAEGVLSKNSRVRAAVLRSKREASELSQVFGGRAAKPQQEVVVVGPDGRTPILVAGLGVTEVAEIEDVIHEAVERAEKRMKDYGQQLPIQEYRERRGMPQADKVPERIYEAFEQAQAQKRGK